MGLRITLSDWCPYTVLARVPVVPGRVRPVGYIDIGARQYSGRDRATVWENSPATLAGVSRQFYERSVLVVTVLMFWSARSVGVVPCSGASQWSAPGRSLGTFAKVWLPAKVGTSCRSSSSRRSAPRPNSCFVFASGRDRIGAKVTEPISSDELDSAAAAPFEGLNNLARPRPSTWRRFRQIALTRQALSRTAAAFAGLVAVVIIGACHAPDEVQTPDSDSPRSSAEATEPVTSAPTDTNSPTNPTPIDTTSETTPTVPLSQPDLLFVSFGDAHDILKNLTLLTFDTAMRDAQPNDGSVIVGASSRDNSNVLGLAIATPDELASGLRVPLETDFVALYATIRRARQDLSAFVATAGKVPVVAASQCAQRLRDLIDDDNLVVACFSYTDRASFDAEARDENGDTELVCAAAFAYAGPGKAVETPAVDLGPALPSCPIPASPVQSSPAGDAIDTGIEGVLRPASAIASPTEDGLGGPADANNRVFRQPGWTLDDFQRFYDAVMPPGQPWNTWSWCTERALDQLVERIWADQTTEGTGILRLTIASDDQGPYVLVSRFGSCDA